MSTAAIPALQLSAENKDISVLATDPGAWPTAVESLSRPLAIGFGALLVLAAGLVALLLSLM